MWSYVGVSADRTSTASCWATIQKPLCRRRAPTFNTTHLGDAHTRSRPAVGVAASGHLNVGFGRTGAGQRSRRDRLLALRGVVVDVEQRLLKRNGRRPTRGGGEFGWTTDELGDLNRSDEVVVDNEFDIVA